MRDYLGELLSEQYQVAFASNGRQALHLLETKETDLIVSDIGMPEMDGFEFLRQLREDRQQFIPVLFLTGHTDKSEVIQALLSGVDAYVTKPFESDELIARVKGLLDNDRRRKTAYAGRPGKDEEGMLSHPAEAENKEVSYRVRWLKELEGVVHSEIGNSYIKIPDLAYKMAVSERTLRNRIKNYTGLSPNEYLMEARMNQALYLLENKVYATVSEVAYAVGIDHISYFTKQFKERFSKTPSQYL